MTKTANINNLTKRQGKGLTPCSVLLRSFSEPLSFLLKTAEVKMSKRSWVERRGGKFCVMTGNITNLGFTDVKKQDSYETLEAANVKADLSNYIWQKCREVSVR